MDTGRKKEVAGIFVDKNIDVSGTIIKVILKKYTIEFWDGDKIVNRFEYKEIDNKLISSVATVLIDANCFEKKKEARAWIQTTDLFNKLSNLKDFLDIKVESFLNDKKKEFLEKKEIDNIKLDNYQDNVQKFWQRQPFFYDKSKLFFLWDVQKKKYDLVDNTDMMILLDKILGLEGQTVTSQIKANYKEAFERVGRIHIPPEAPKKWIQFKGKAFSLNSKRLYDVKPNYFFTNPIPWDIGDSDETPVIDKLITEWVGEKYKQTAYEIIAYCCLAEYPIHLLFCLVGCGRNGKSKFLGLIHKFIGSDNICSTELDTLMDSRFESFKLYKKLVCTMGETNFGVISKTSLLKKLTGQDLIGFEFKNKKPFDSINYAKIIISSNSLPVSNDTSEGFYRRWLILDFPNIFPEGKDILKDIPDIEFNNLAKKVIDILPILLNNGKFTNQGTIQERKQKYILASNPLSHFLKEYCNNEYGSFMRYSELYIAYRQYLHHNKKRRINFKEFNDVLALEGFEITRTSKKIGDEYVNGKFVEGITLKDNIDFMNVVKVIKKIPVKTLYVQNGVKKPTQLSQHSQSPMDKFVEIEELITPEIRKCTTCGLNPCHFYAHGKYFCKKECINQYEAQK